MSRPRVLPLLALLQACACAPRSEVAATTAADEATERGADVPTPSKRALPRPPVAGPPALEGELGTAHPLTLQGIARDGQWVAICQARTDTTRDGRVEIGIGRHGDLFGDEMKPYLVREPGAGEEVDAFVGYDETGRHLAVVSGGTMRLVDTWTNHEHPIAGADAKDDPNPYGPHRAVSFDAGHRAAWSELGKDQRSRIVVRDLDEGSELRIDAGAGLLWRFDLDASGQWLWIWSVTSDTDKDGTLELPHARTSLGDRFCRGPVSVSGHYGWNGDTAVLAVAPVRAGAVPEQLDALGVLGGELVFRKPDKSIVRRGPDGEHELVPASCAGRVVHSDEGQRSIWVACMSSAKPDMLDFSLAPLHRFGRDGHDDTKLVIQVGPTDEWRQGDPLLLASDQYVNVTTGTIGRSISGPPYAFFEDRVLYVPAEGAFWYDLATGKKHRLSIPTDGDSTHATKGSLVALMADDRRAVVFDLATEVTRGFVTGQPLALTPTGEVLVAKGGDRYGPLQGPLHWAKPE